MALNKTDSLYLVQDFLQKIEVLRPSYSLDSTNCDMVFLKAKLTIENCG